MECKNCGSKWESGQKASLTLTVCPFCGESLGESDDSASNVHVRKRKVLRGKIEAQPQTEEERAERGDVDAQFNLGWRYETGDGVGQDWVQAVYWYRKAADQGHDYAQNNLGVCYDNGNGVGLAEQGTQANFGAEAVNTLMKVMEDKKEDFVVIFAGYDKEMKKFLEINPGIESRIGYTFHFQDYTAEELLQIFETKMAACDFKVNEKAKAAALEVFRHYCKVHNFGNGRFVDKVIRQTLMNQSRGYEFNTMNLIGEEVIPTKEDMGQIMGNPGNAGYSGMGFHANRP